MSHAEPRAAELRGGLSPAEIAMAGSIEPDADGLWRMYRRALARASTARDELRRRLRQGLTKAPAFDAGSEAFSSAAIELRDVLDLIDRHAEAQRALYDAAQTICDCLELADAGRAEGVKWTLELCTRRKS